MDVAFTIAPDLFIYLNKVVLESGLYWVPFFIFVFSLKCKKSFESVPVLLVFGNSYQNAE